MPFAKEKGQPAIYYETIGKGTPIIFIPPPGVGHLTFRYQVPLMDQCKLITFDVRGDCQSERSTEPMTMTQLAYDVKRVLDANCVRKAIVCGYSNGAAIAQEFALTYPERTAGVILIGGYFAVKNFLLEKEYKLGIWAARNELMPLLASGLAKNHFIDKQAANELYAEIMKTDPQMLADQYTTGLHYSSEDRLHQLRVPLLLIYGANDHYLQPYQTRFRELVHDVEIVYIQGVKHQVPSKAPHECNAVLREWMRRKQFIPS
ncbi:alpha/beta fold hydrolase [Halalkalibacterium halodurans]|uniref:alpha/beta fold hydrolase n=1 Tax=Halalkalibacterium halodurans TaxID=86665 RepID=UPI002AA9FAB2|nr:alpha/beta hydrolase [Halalkalibacterium halodurans]MDY7223249.1 alpha/beta hydrolase [Halalkalibacterium halodurans]MDY7242470.1 alpha/beta hydrolase [Halalkalibacterium halodurans]